MVSSLTRRLERADGLDPPWVIEHAVKMQMSHHREAEEARRTRLSVAREKERKIRQKHLNGAFRGGERKRARIGEVAGQEKEDEDEEFLPEDGVDEQGDGGGVFLSKEVRDLMAK